jgi:predicted PurR-regulated permease PerM
VFGNINGNEVLQSLLGGTDGGTVFTRTAGVFSGVFAFITVLVISFYLVVADQKGMKELIRPLVPEKNRDMVMSLVLKIQKKMGLWVLGQIILSIAIFVFTYVGLTILGVKYALVLALLAGLLEVVPYMGPFLAAVPAVLFAFVQSPALALAVIVLYILVQKSESYVLVPKIMQKTVGTSPLVVLVSLLIGFKLAGILGLLLAVPIAGALMVLLEEFRGESADVRRSTTTE